MPCHFCHGCLLNYIQNVTFEVPSDHRKWDAMIKKEIHCCWSVSWPSSDTQRRWDELLAASTNSLLFISCHICCGELSNCTPKYQIVSTLPPIIVGKRMLRYKERYPLLLKWFVTFFRRIRMVWGDSGSIYKYRIVHIMSFSSRPTIKLHTKFKILGTLHAQEMGPYTVRRGIHRCWSIS